MYWLLARLFGPLADLFYRRSLEGEAIPKEGPVLLVANHPNGLVDPLLLIRNAGRPVRFLAKEPLFRMPIIGGLLRRLGALPVYRAGDGHDTEKNQQTFRAVFEALGRGDAVGIFPEGTSHSDPSLKPLKTGAARMVLGAESERHFALGAVVVPVGLLYRKKAVFRSEALTVVGEPIPARSFRERHEQAPKDAVHALTEAIDQGLRKVTVNLDRWEDQPILEMAARLWRLESGHELTQLRRLAEGDRALRASHPERLERLRARVIELGESLARLGLRVEHLDERYRLATASRFVLRNLLGLLVGLPVAGLGAAAYFLPYQSVRLVVWGLKPELDLVATYKILLSTLVYPLWHTALVLALALEFGGAAAFLGSLGLPLAGLYTQQFIAHRSAAGRELWAFVRRPLLARSKKRLQEDRDWIRAELDALASLYRLGHSENEALPLS